MFGKPRISQIATAAKATEESQAVMPAGFFGMRMQHRKLWSGEGLSISGNQNSGGVVVSDSQRDPALQMEAARRSWSLRSLKELRIQGVPCIKPYQTQVQECHLQSGEILGRSCRDAKWDCDSYGLLVYVAKQMPFISG